MCTTTTTATKPAVGQGDETTLQHTTVDIVIPVLNEEKGLEGCVTTLLGAVAELEATHGYRCTVTIVDNGSTDRSWATAERLARTHPHVRCINLARPGRGGALRRAWSEGDADIHAYMDVDLSTRLDALPPLLGAIAGGSADIAIGSRLAPGSAVVRSANREVISRVYNIIARLALGYPVRDSQCGFKAVTREVARTLVPLVEDDSWFFDTELLALAWRTGLRIHEVPVHWVEDDDSRVKLASTAIDDLRGIWRLVRERGRTLPPSDRPRPSHTTGPAARTGSGSAGPQFDRHASGYGDAVDRSIAFTGRDAAFFARRKVDLLDELAGRHGRSLAGSAVLDVGCGTGTTDRFLGPRARSLTGVDVSDEMLSIARSEVPGVEFSSYDGATLPFEDGTFDIVTAICVLHHVDPPDRPHLVAEMHRVLAPGGLMAIFEHNPYNPLTRRAVSTCPLDQGVVLLPAGEVGALVKGAGATPLERRSFLFTPLAGKTGQRVDRLFAPVPLGGQYVVVAASGVLAGDGPVG